ncbi:hypothetical protein CMV_014579 [Castanea mollissima]|uniref:Uncharacterized protein n=1 Tax=Castanea mollissima TaxID=60419 RepID=A0A8J4QXE9_9ROSI|nr:hypothetical protein CMV_014579 [Castanea mollissima]
MKFNRSRQSWGRFYCTKLMHVLPYNASPHYLHHQEEVYVLSGKASGKRWNMTFPAELSQGSKDRNNSFSSPICYKFLQNFMGNSVGSKTHFVQPRSNILFGGKLAAIGSVDDHVRVIWMSDVSDCTQIKHYVCLSSSCCLIYYNNPQS